MSWRLVSLALLFVATPFVSCSKPPRFVPVSQAYRAAVASFLGTLKHDPALFLVIRPDRLASGTAAIEKLVRSLDSVEPFEEVLGLDLNQGVGARIALHDDRARPANQRRAQVPLRSIFDPEWYRTAATFVGIDGVPAAEARRHSLGRGSAAET